MARGCSGVNIIAVGLSYLFPSLSVQDWDGFGAVPKPKKQASIRDSEPKERRMGGNFAWKQDKERKRVGRVPFIHPDFSFSFLLSSFTSIFLLAKKSIHQLINIKHNRNQYKQSKIDHAISQQSNILRIFKMGFFFPVIYTKKHVTTFLIYNTPHSYDNANPEHVMFPTQKGKMAAYPCLAQITVILDEKCKLHRHDIHFHINM